MLTGVWSISKGFLVIALGKIKPGTEKSKNALAKDIILAMINTDSKPKKLVSAPPIKAETPKDKPMAVWSSDQSKAVRFLSKCREKIADHAGVYKLKAMACINCTKNKLTTVFTKRKDIAEKPA